jgi:hypothetical protein
MPRQDTKLDLWTPAGNSGGRKHPESVRASLVGDVLQMSMNAVLLLKYYGTDPPVPQGVVIGPTPPRPGAAIAVHQRLRKKRSELAKTLLEALVIHHHPEGGEIRETPLKQKDLCRILNWQYPRDQGKLARLMKEVFVPPPKPGDKKRRSNAMIVYRRTCKRGGLKDLWEKKETSELQERLGIKGDPRDMCAEVLRNILGLGE